MILTFVLNLNLGSSQVDRLNSTSEITDDPNVEAIEEKMDVINPESARQETTEGLQNKLKKNFETMDKDKSGLVTVKEMWYVILNFRFS